MPLILLIIYLVSFWYVRKSLIHDDISNDYLLGLIITVVPVINSIAAIIYLGKNYNTNPNKLLKRFFGK